MIYVVEIGISLTSDDAGICLSTSIGCQCRRMSHTDMPCFESYSAQSFHLLSSLSHLMSTTKNRQQWPNFRPIAPSLPQSTGVIGQSALKPGIDDLEKRKWDDLVSPSMANLQSMITNMYFICKLLNMLISFSSRRVNRE